MEAYSQADEAQFRAVVERAIQEVAQAVQERIGSVTLAASDNDDYEPGPFTTVLRASGNAAGSNLTGVAGGYDGRSLRVINVSANNVVLVHQDAGSAASNRLLAETGANVTLGANDAADLWYDAVTERWRIFPLT